MTGQASEQGSRYYMCCPPMGRWGTSLCGWLIVAIGVGWLLGNLDLIPADWWNIVLPVALIGWGIATLYAAWKRSE